MKFNNNNNNMREIINIINDQFKNHKITIDIEQKRIDYYNSNNGWWLGAFYLETNELHFSYSFWFYHDIKKHFKNIDEMNEFIKPVLEKIIGRLLNRVT